MTSRDTTHRPHRSRRGEADDNREEPRRHRSASPGTSPSRRRHHHHHHHATHRKKRTRSPAVVLPLNAAPISARNFTLLSNIFASYLEVQKNIELHTLTDREAKGRFKSFVSHFNRGELARGWYERVVSAQRDGPSATTTTATAASASASTEPTTKRVRHASPDSSSSSDDDFGPALPQDAQTGGARKHGPAPPKTQDLSLQRELETEDQAYARADGAHARRLDRRAQKEALDELVPRAEPGTRERQLEKKREVNEKMRGFRDPSPGGEVDESTLLGASTGGESFAQKKAALERKKNEREIRREQLLKARIAEREERVQGMKEKEEKTMTMLKALAASRFGGSGSGTSE